MINIKAVFMSSNKDSLFKVYPEQLRSRFSKIVDIIGTLSSFTPEALSESNTEKMLNETDIILSTWGMPRFEKSFISQKMPFLKAVFYGAGSVQGFAHEFLDENKIVVSAWGANAVPVAEFTVAQIILAAKGYFQRFKHTSEKTWENRSAGGYFKGNYNSKIGIIGAGMIGKLVIRMLNEAYKMDIYVFDPFLSDEEASSLGVKKVSLEYIFSNCDVISNHLANNAQTAGMLNGNLFSLMSNNSAFINTGRGAQVVEDDLCRAMAECPGRVALLDVTYPEPPVNGSPLYTLPNIFLSPHIAGSIGDEVCRMGEFMYDELCRFLDDKPLLYSVTKSMLATMA